MTNRKSHTSFRLVPKSTTLDDLEGRYALRYISKRASFGAHHENLNEERQRCRRKTQNATIMNSQMTNKTGQKIATKSVTSLAVTLYSLTTLFHVAKRQSGGCMVLLKPSSNQPFIISIARMPTSWVLSVLLHLQFRFKQIAPKISSANADLRWTSIITNWDSHLLTIRLQYDRAGSSYAWKLTTTLLVQPRQWTTTCNWPLSAIHSSSVQLTRGETKKDDDESTTMVNCYQRKQIQLKRIY